MKLYIAESKAKELMNTHGLSEWRFLFDSAKRRFGYCSYRSKTISLSAPLTSLNDDEHVINTILHEIAHALVGPHNGHGVTWKRQAMAIGCTGQQFYSPAVSEPTLKYTVTCLKCGSTQQKARKSKNQTACGRCCKRYNGGRWTKEYLLKFTIN